MAKKKGQMTELTNVMDEFDVRIDEKAVDPADIDVDWRFSLKDKIRKLFASLTEKQKKIIRSRYPKWTL